MDHERDDPLSEAEKAAGYTADGRPLAEGPVMGAGEDGADRRRPGGSARDRLLKVASTAVIWRCPDGVAHATVPVDGHLEHWPVGSRGFRDWLLRSYGAAYTIEIEGREQPAAANKQAIAEALDHVEARALGAEVSIHEPALRSVRHEGKLYIDLGAQDWRVVEVTANGWGIRDRAPVPILRTRRTRPLPLPECGGSIKKLRSFLPVLEHEFPLLVMWLLAAIWPGTTFPMLALAGEHGAGKSTATRVLRRLVDPAGGDLLQPPGTDRDLVAVARHNRVLAFDNLSKLPPELADSLCRLATGAEIGGRSLFTNDDVASFAAARPIVLNGIPDVATRGDLASRSVAITLEPLAHRKDEAAFWAAFELASPGIFGALLDGLVIAIRDLPDTPTPQGHRMADFAKLAAAASPAFGWRADEVLALLGANAREQAAKLAEGDLVAAAVTAVFGGGPR